VSDEKRFNWTVALILFGVLFLGVSDTQLVAPLLPLIAQDLGTTPGHAGIIVTTYSLAAAGFALFVGPLSDRVGRKKVLVSGLALFTMASFFTYHVSSFNVLVILRAMTGLAAGTLSTSALSFAGDYYAYQQRGRAMGVLSMGYFVAFVVGVPAGALAASKLGWQWVFGCLSAAAALMMVWTMLRLPQDERPTNRQAWGPSFINHFTKRDRMAGMAAAFLTSGGIVGFLTYIGAWLRTTFGMSIERIGSCVHGFRNRRRDRVSPIRLAGGSRGQTQCDHLGQCRAFRIVFAGRAIKSERRPDSRNRCPEHRRLARQAPLHALTTEIVPPEIRGEYIALRNAASQIGIAAVATISASAFDAAGFTAVAWIAAITTLLVPLCCTWLKSLAQ
jgi:predicted MFS family arabinose efflux permease